AGQDRQRVTVCRSALAHPAAVPLAAAEEREDLDIVARWRHVGVGGDNQGRHLEPADLVREIEILRHRLADLPKQAAEILWARRDPLVELIHRRILHELRGLGPEHALLRKHFW